LGVFYFHLTLNPSPKLGEGHNTPPPSSYSSQEENYPYLSFPLPTGRQASKWEGINPLLTPPSQGGGN